MPRSAYLAVFACTATTTLLLSAGRAAAQDAVAEPPTPSAAGAADAPAARSGAPGVCDCYAPPPAPAPSPPPVQGWDGRQRWGIGLRLGAAGLHPEDDPDAETEYSSAGIDLRYRLNARWEITAGLAHLQEQREDGTPGEHALQSVTLGALFHMRPQAAWDWYFLGGLGVTTDAVSDDTPDAEAVRRASSQGHIHLGAGIERRFRHFGIAAELRLIGLQPMQERDADAATAPAQTRSAQAPATPMPADDDTGTAGGELSLAATYYF